ncbi:hypothetical protein [Domibacillus robiginosus]|uniref:hypothetical protein n=1 Tax=Domibacillus robiginosus TaxID=1071054 RepID=UPI00067C0FE7|nr:hypothetical protein [Domibacillus robiginosus]
MDRTMFAFAEEGKAIGTVKEWADHIQLLMASAEQDIKVTSLPAAASMFMRRYGLFLAGHLAVFSKERRIWNGDADEIEIVMGSGDGWPLLFRLKHENWVSCGDEGADLLISRLAEPIILHLSKKAKLPAMISRENIFGYVLWMYVHILNDTRDLALLPGFQRFLRGQSPQDAMANFSRLTCCLYKEVPGCEKCPYCPLLGKKNCETARTI